MGQKSGYFKIKHIFDGNDYFCQTVEMKKILPNSFEPQNVPHPADLRFSGVLKNFCLKLTKKNSRFCPKSDQVKKSHEFPRNDL